jgi:hypothetical protein
MSARVTRIPIHERSSLSWEATRSLQALVLAAESSLAERRTCLANARAHLQHLDAQIAEFIRDRSQPPRDPGIFLCQIAVHLRGLANELDGASR